MAAIEEGVPAPVLTTALYSRFASRDLDLVREQGDVGDARRRSAGTPRSPRRGMSQTADVLVIFGITGDLAKVMTFRSLYRLERRGLLDCPIVGVAGERLDRRRPARARRGVHQRHGRGDRRRGVRAASPRACPTSPATSRDAATYERVRDAIGDARSPVFYLEIPPSLFGTVVEGLADAGLTRGARVVVEKPFGHDLASARALNEELHRHLDESQLLRIDHFLGKMGLRRDPLPALRQHDARAGLEPAATSRACRSRWPRASASRTAATSTTRSARCATSWSTTSCRSSRRRRWSRRRAATRTTLKDAKSHVFRGDARRRPGALRARPVRRLPRRRRRRRGLDHRDVRGAAPARSTTGAGTACRSSSAPASTCP